jgi:hypothetical protein
MAITSRSTFGSTADGMAVGAAAGADVGAADGADVDAAAGAEVGAGVAAPLSSSPSLEHAASARDRIRIRIKPMSNRVNTRRDIVAPPLLCGLSSFLYYCMSFTYGRMVADNRLKVNACYRMYLHSNILYKAGVMNSGHS